MIDRFHHLFVCPADYDASVGFYREVLGWSVTRAWGGDGAQRGSVLSGGGVKVVVAERSNDAVVPHVHLDIHDVDARYAKIPKGTHVVREPEDTPWGTRWFVVRDPDGTLIAFEEVHRRGR